MQTKENQLDNVTTLLVSPNQEVLLESLNKETNYFDHDSQLQKMVYELKMTCSAKEFYQVLKRLIKLARWYKNPRIIDVIDAVKLKKQKQSENNNSEENNVMFEHYKLLADEREQQIAKEQEAETLREISDTSFCSGSYANFSSKVFPETRV